MNLQNSWMTRLPFWRVLGLVGLVAVGLYIINLAPAPLAWVEWPPDFCRGVNCYCEPIRLDRLVAQPVATFSNLGFVAAGLLVGWATLKRPASPNSILAEKAYGLIYGAGLVCTGLFSFFYHASLTKVGDFLDLMGVYLFTSFLLLFNINRLRRLKPSIFAITYIAINVTLALGLWLAYSFQQVYFAILIGGLLIAEALVWRREVPRLQLRWLGAALGLFALGAAVWILDGSSTLPCWPSLPFSWHAVWHVCAAGAAGLMYVYYRSGDQIQRRTLAL